MDDFCKVFVPLFERRIIGNGKKSNKPCRLSLSEIMTIEALFHLSGAGLLRSFIWTISVYT